MPLRVRLTLWYGTALALVLIVFGSALYAVLARGLRDQIDQSLEGAAVVAVRAVEQHRIGPFLPFAVLAEEFPELAVLDKTFQFFSPSGTITIQSPNLGRQDIPRSRRALELRLNGRATFESARFQDGSSIRLLSVPIQQGGALVSIVQVGTSLRPVEEMLHRLVLILLVSAPLALAVALGGGWFLADRALRPVEAITQAAQRIAAGDLTQRLAVSSSSDEVGRLAATFNDMIARLEASFRQEHGVQVTVGTVEPAVVRGDELRLRELLLNLVDNAVKYSRPGGKVEIALVREGTTARLSVMDQGIGIAPEELGRIFDRFYRTDAARAHAKKGTGLGLSICKWIAEAHHGRIEAQSTMGQGSKFTVVLPVVPP